MSFLDLVNKRYSVRAYKNTPIEDDKLSQILEAARLAPTGANRQAFKLIVVHTKGREEELKPIYRGEWFTQAPVFICACAVTEPEQPYREAGHYRNIAIVMDHVIMAATDLGLGTCWIGAYDAEATRKILGIPEEAHPVVMATIGYADDQPKERKRKPIEEIISYEKW